MEITEDYCSFELSKLLKEKGFAKESYVDRYSIRPTLARYWTETGVHKGSDEDGWPVTYNIKEGKMLTPSSELWFNVYTDKHSICAPTLQMACKWLREVHNIYINVNLFFPGRYKSYKPVYYACVLDIFNGDNLIKNDCPLVTDTTLTPKEFDSPQQACEAAIKYCLENLI